MTPDLFDYEAARRFRAAKRLQKNEVRMDLWKSASGDAEKIVRMIRYRYHPEKILQWGSLLSPGHFSEASDIDLAVVGISSLDFLRLAAEAEKLTRFPLHLIRMESLTPEFFNIIHMRSRVVYERP